MMTRSMAKNDIGIKRIYDPPQKSDGLRLLIDRLWPRGIKKTEAAIDLWLKEIAPSNALRKWFNHDPEKWLEFQQRYIQELQEKPELIEFILEKASKQSITLLYSAKDTQSNNAQVLQAFLKAWPESPSF
ncbi:MAG: hypothetical protein K0S11_1226 [Gammaproteobacteria bacterium]|jgi:uncharacterized protein YeaO (DUF488 family)|nr:hypothetical protein [Gammaproteobacteria bacterium]